MTRDPDEPPEQTHRQPQSADPREALRAAYRIVFTWFRRRVPDEHTAYDLTQITFLRFRAWQNGNPGLMPESLEAFLLQQAEWVRCDHFRKAVKTRAIEARSGDPVDVAALEDGRLLASISPESALSAIPSRIDLARAVASLTDTKRLALVLRFVDDLAPARIAEVLGVCPRRVNQMIKESLEELAHSEPLAGYGTPKGGNQ